MMKCIKDVLTDVLSKKTETDRTRQQPSAEKEIIIPLTNVPKECEPNAFLDTQEKLKKLYSSWTDLADERQHFCQQDPMYKMSMAKYQDNNLAPFLKCVWDKVEYIGDQQHILKAYEEIVCNATLPAEIDVSLPLL